MFRYFNSNEFYGEVEKEISRSSHLIQILVDEFGFIRFNELFEKDTIGGQKGGRFLKDMYELYLAKNSYKSDACNEPTFEIYNYGLFNILGKNQELLLGPTAILPDIGEKENKHKKDSISFLNRDIFFIVFNFIKLIKKYHY